MFDFDVDPETIEKLRNPMWRIMSGELYKIMIKGDGEEDEPTVIPFIPNANQVRLIENLWYRNSILKARQLGFTTAVAILWLDHALFVPNQRCGIVAHDQQSAQVIFRDKVKFAYENLPDWLSAMARTKADSADELLFAHNNSSIRVATSMRSGVIQRLHVSEFGKICAKYPDKAAEVMTGSIPAVPLNGILIIESTAEGQDGPFYKITTRAKALADEGVKLNKRQYRLHFFAWWQNPEYRMDPADVVVTDADNAYFDEVEAECGIELDQEQCAWYVATRDADYPDEPEKMNQEYPSFPEEAFRVSMEGCYYTKQLADARKQGRVLTIPLVTNVPVNTFWDVGRGDMTAIWFHQLIGMEHRFIKYLEASGETLEWWFQILQDERRIWGRHFLPHDAEHKRLSRDNKSIMEMLDDIGLDNIEIVPKVDDINIGIQQTRSAFSQAYFDKIGCKNGLIRLANYRKRWNATQQCWANEPLHKGSDGPDAFRQWAQALHVGMLASRKASSRKTKPRNWKAA